MPAALAIPAIIGAGASVGGAVIASKASKGAAKTQSEAADKALGLQTQQYEQSRQDFAPYQQQGQAALGRLGQMATAPRMNFGAGQTATLGNPMGQPQAQQPPPQPQAGLVRVQAPTGEIALLSRQQAQDALRRGARVMP